MRKLNSIIFGSLLISAMLSGCGMPGPLYQKTDEQPKNSINTISQEQPNEQQEQ